MTQWLRFSLVLTMLLSGCNRAAENKEAVKQGVLQHLQKNAALDLNQLSVDVTNVQFKGTEAVAAVSITPKSAPDQGMKMSYTLERHGEKWDVKGRASGHGEASTGAGAITDPSSSGTPPEATPKTGALPQGHPPVNAPAPQSK